mmetsp:Transcript_31047/g.98585  ORF Transcript_31047/g.98585 Transcript_31047/m.98585 type:complete len:332 (-) Transcript_31047:179-1174(-)|eukprot:CAMPEP_0118862558 /NCGR_PEP_ID=MMETSP1163-20130328/7720_1 /TAXON_ID=124430 /ORGANISM="Phaeomonas parva, Strain CCMP2877" /LENGTH=331 /DNA_ID=CAMNT_0006796473 /DNA_START=174 /DNA_END=1169 /DNA_ORIENTATION=+
MRAILAALATAALATAATTPPKTIAVTGATGKLGRFVVQDLVKRGYGARILLRHEITPEIEPSSDPDAPKAAVAAWLAAMPGVECVKGDINDEDSLKELLVGCSAVLAVHGARRTRKISDLWKDPSDEPAHAKQVNFEGIRNLIAAAEASDACKRIVRITGNGEDPWGIFSILINGLGCMAKAWNYEGENLLRSSSLDYTIVRPGVMKEAPLAPRSLGIADDGGSMKITPVPHSAIANLCVDCLDFPNTARTTMAAMTVEEGKGADNWNELLPTVQADQRAFPDDLLVQHQNAVKFGGAGIIAILGAGAFAFLSLVAAGVKATMVAVAAML